jgi:hypothetical protein
LKYHMYQNVAAERAGNEPPAMTEFFIE